MTPNSKMFWELRAERFIRNNNYRDREEYKTIVKHIEPPVFEFGSAFGMLVKYLPDDYHYHGVEWSETMVKIAEHKHGKYFFECVDGFKYIERIKRGGYKYGTAIALQVIEHFENVADIIKPLQDISKQVLFSVPRGKLTDAQRRRDGHVQEWLTNKDVIKDFSRFGEIELFPGQENHICGIIL